MSLPTMTIIGNLTKDPELRRTSSGKTVVNFTIAANNRRLNQATNQWEDGDALFLTCNAWDGTNNMLASNIAASLAKGMTVIATGQVRQRQYQAKDGTNRYAVEMTVDHLGYDLRKSAVAVNRPQQQSGFNNGGFQQQPNGWGAPTQQQQQQAMPPQQAQQQAPVADPWANQSNNFGGFGSSEFTDNPNDDDF